jgi:hypothetical protein
MIYEEIDMNYTISSTIYRSQHDLQPTVWFFTDYSMIYRVNSIIYEDNSTVQSRQYDLYRHKTWFTFNSMIYADFNMNHTDTSMICTYISMASAVTSMIYAENMIDTVSSMICSTNMIARDFWPTPISSPINCTVKHTYSGADKSLARPGRKQATATEDFEFHISYL